jgi:2-oxoacid:acceptor oxidoreductase gamma subunit (pyruvate/2-ketoisovalerate family)
LVKAGKYAQFIPAFGVERKGSPVYGYFRLDEKPIRPSTQVYYPNGLFVLDESLLSEVDVFSGVKDKSFLVLNTKKSLEELTIPEQVKIIALLDATAIAVRTIKREIPNTVMFGALARLELGIDLETLAEFIQGRFGEANYNACKAGYEEVKVYNRG